MEIGRMVIGKVIQSNSVWRAVSVSVQRMKLDVNTNVYVNTESLCWAADPHLNCSLGDLVLIKSLDEPQSDRIKHYVKKIVFPVGNIIDPPTGRRCRGTEFMDESNRKVL